MIRILHTSDLQLGMTRRFLGHEAQARYTDDQFDALRRLAKFATEHNCDAVVIAGDVFDAVLPDRRIIARSIDALGSFEVPVFLLPGNHDAGSPESIWTTGNLSSRLPPNVTVIRDSTVHSVNGGRLEIVGAPWTSRRPDRDLVALALEHLEPPSHEVTRILVGHGGVDSINPDPGNLNLIRLASLESAISEGLIHYVALGDRHSALSIGVAGRVWYSGAPVMTSFREDLETTNRALVVTFDTDVAVDQVEVGQWEFRRIEIAASGADLVEAVGAELARPGDRARTAIRFVLEGTVNLAERAELDQILDEAGDLYASVRLSEDHCDLAVLVDDADLTTLAIGGYGDDAVADLIAMSAQGGDTGDDAVLALRTLYRLLEGAR
ncbi:MAG: exonuclease SbcCD subunit D [Acidimicrobiaceae bacterium]|nr:exonuclease SbcCD subunit D [Acidimicrobiaceae bacterium]